MSLVVDASLVVAALADSGPIGTWAEGVLEEDDLAAPHLLPVEAANILRRSSASGALSVDQAAPAHADLLHLHVELFPYAPFGRRVWQLHQNLTAYDAWYVALAESLHAPPATLDLRVMRSPGPTCAFRTPPSDA